MLNIDIKPYSALPCELEVFRINGIKADIDDFGNNYDANPEIADEYHSKLDEIQKNFKNNRRGIIKAEK